MEASEFRIGNWVNNNEEDCQITSAIIAQLERDDSTAQPIILTPEWLVRFGFVRGEKDNFSFTKSMNLRIIGSEYDYSGIWFGEVYYVHQLQNLYYALRGTELTVS
jgi:hypothetical protein